MIIFFRSNKEIVTVNFNANNIVLSLFKNDLIISYVKCELINFEIFKLNIFNFSKVQLLIHNFLKSNNLKNPKFYISASCDDIKEKIIKSRSIIDDKNEIYENSTLNWNCYNLGSFQDSYVYYISGISHSLIFQYKILAANLGMNINFLLPENAVLLNLCTKYNPDFLEKFNEKADIKNCFVDFVNNLNIENYISKNLELDINKEKIFLSTALGLFFWGKE